MLSKLKLTLINELRHGISNNVVCATSKVSDQPAHTRSLIRALDFMTVKLLTEHHLEFLSLKEGCTCSSESTQCQTATLLEIKCRGSNIKACRNLFSCLPTTINLGTDQPVHFDHHHRG